MAKKSKKAVEQAMEVDSYEYRPSIELTEKIYPQAKDLKVDEEVTLEIRVKVTSIRRNDWGDKKLCVSATVLDADEDNDEDD
jgi:hypothetical protein